MVASEFDIIQRYFAESGLQFPRDGVNFGIGDDAAILQLPAHRLLVMSMDVLVETIHFPEHADPALIAQRALAVNLSDMAAMGAEPLCFTLGLTLPRADTDWLAGFSAGLLLPAQHFNCPLVGGDLSRGPLNIAIQVQGTVAPDKVIRRNGAAVGDQVYVTGNLGDGALALAAMGISASSGSVSTAPVRDDAPLSAYTDYLQAAYYQPEPRIQLAQKLAPFVSSGIDISDGLAGDLGHVLRASNVGALLHAAHLPYSDAALACMSEANRQLAALYGGDDYELCVTVAPQNCAAAEAAARELGTEFTRIGEIVAEPGLRIINSSGEIATIQPAAYQHFKSQDKS